MAEGQAPGWQKRTCFCGQPMRYVGIISVQETNAREVFDNEIGEFDVIDVTTMEDLDKWVCEANKSHIYTEYPFFRNYQEGDR